MALLPLYFRTSFTGNDLENTYISVSFFKFRIIHNDYAKMPIKSSKFLHVLEECDTYLPYFPSTIKLILALAETE